MARPLDYESVTSYNIIVVSTDGGGLKVGPISKNECGNTLRKSHADGLKVGTISKNEYGNTLRKSHAAGLKVGPISKNEYGNTLRKIAR